MAQKLKPNRSDKRGGKLKQQYYGNNYLFISNRNRIINHFQF